MWHPAGVQPPEACFAVDSDGRITRWSHAATASLGIPAPMALGHLCFEVIGGRALFRRSDCRVGCGAFLSLAAGQVSATHRLTVQAAGRSRRVLCQPVALPDPPGGAVIALVPESRSPGRSMDALGTLHDLACLGSLATSLQPDAPERSIERILDWLREATGAEVAEIFVAEPGGGDMLLSDFRGPFRSAFFEICRFEPGQGFPGVVEISGEPIATHDLASEPRYLRSRVKDRGFRSYVCVPVRGVDSVIGSLNVAARHADLDLQRAQRLLGWASALLGTLLQASLHDNRLSPPAPAPPSLVGSDPLEELLHDTLHRLARVGQASDGSLFLSRADGVASRVTMGSPGAVACARLQPDHLHMCPAVAGSHGVALHGPRRLWPEACRRLSTRGGVAHCLPLVAGGMTLGVAQLRYPPGRLSPPTRHLTDLLHLAQQAAWSIRPASLLRDRAPNERSQGIAARKTGRAPGGNEGRLDSQRPPPFLEIRCLGSFQLFRQGKLITPDQVPRRGALAVLKILLVHHGRRVSRDLLAEFLWPEAEPNAGANRLHLLIHALRQLVEPEPQGRRWAYIRNDGDCYYFNDEAPYWLDVDEFLSSYQLGRQREREGDATAALACYEAAAALYRGDFLEEEPYADWATGERERLRETYLTLLIRLGSVHAQRNNLEQGIEWYRHALHVDPLREENHRGLMCLLSQAGRRDEALRQYHACCNILREELDVDPLPETKALLDSLKSGQHIPA